jgi:peptidoglycan/LPS O-acetylase OafA/YrhL
MQSRREQIDSLTGLRGVAACWVMAMHFREVTPAQVWHFPVFDGIIANGAYGVDVFFVLSGFVLSHVYNSTFSAGLQKDQVRQFLTFRLARIYPVHLVTFVVMMALFASYTIVGEHSGGLPERYDAATALSSLTLTNAWIPGIQTPNMPAWSVSAEWFAYLLFPALCFLIAGRRWVASLYAAAGLGLAFFQPFGSYDLAHVLSGFLVGMATYHFWPVLDRMNARHSAGPMIAVTIAVWAWQQDPQVTIGLLLFAALILSLTDPQDRLSRILSLRALIYLGEISYSIYMVHWPVRIIIRHGLAMLGLLNMMPPSVLVSCYILVTLAVAAGSYHYVELPGRTLLRRAAKWRVGRQVSAAASSR